ncbi:unnamed protein product [Prorocentrum cordatum]|uniref:Peptide-methionine (S)-S-oxide reductase n=1 Tax=Prorocentrum cordatum TaxID=2364126 RepID=A0ABN9W1X1_9DINO|nr:unnamed protein product [Polarella glacialis]
MPQRMAARGTVLIATGLLAAAALLAVDPWGFATAGAPAGAAAARGAPPPRGAGCAAPGARGPEPAEGTAGAPAWARALLAAAAVASMVLGVLPRPAVAEAGDIDVYFGQGCFWHVQNELVNQEAKILGRSGTQITALTGYAGGTSIGPAGEVCYHNRFSAPDYGQMGHTEVVGMSVPESKVGEIGKVLLDYAASSRAGRHDPQDRGPEYRSAIGLPGGKQFRDKKNQQEADSKVNWSACSRWAWASKLQAYQNTCLCGAPFGNVPAPVEEDGGGSSRKGKGKGNGGQSTAALEAQLEAVIKERSGTDQAKAAQALLEATRAAGKKPEGSQPVAQQVTAAPSKVQRAQTVFDIAQTQQLKLTMELEKCKANSREVLRRWRPGQLVFAALGAACMALASLQLFILPRRRRQFDHLRGSGSRTGLAASPISACREASFEIGVAAGVAFATYASFAIKTYQRLKGEVLRVGGLAGGLLGQKIDSSIAVPRPGWTA